MIIFMYKICYTMITIAELFPRYSTARKWYDFLKSENPDIVQNPRKEDVRLENEYIICIKNKNSETWLLENVEHNRFGPSRVKGYKKEKPYVLEYKIYGKYHRLDGPACYNRVCEEEYWYKNGVLHREDGPCLRKYDGDRIIEEEWKINGVFHRIDGPANMYYDDYDYHNDRPYPKAKKIVEFFIHGQRIDEYLKNSSREEIIYLLESFMKTYDKKEIYGIAKDYCYSCSNCQNCNKNLIT